jgi:putative transposase
MTAEKYLRWSRVSVYWQMCRIEGTMFAKSTFYKYCNLLGYGRRRGPIKCKKNTAGVKATKVGEIIHADITEIYTRDNTKVFMLFVQDNYSRNIVGFHAAVFNTAALQAATIKKVLIKLKADLYSLSIITDGGSEIKE